MKTKKNIFSLSKQKSRTAIGNYDYKDVYSREETIDRLLDTASKNKNTTVAYWKKMRAYYDGSHSIKMNSMSFSNEVDLPWEAAQATDGYIHVESQIEAALPSFEFSPRGDDDAKKAKQRETVTRYICDINDLESKNSRNERRLCILGSAVWKVCWDGSVKSGSTLGEVLIDNPRPEQIFPDPSSLTVDGCEYIGYVYRMHRQRAKRVFKNDMKAAGAEFSDFINHKSGISQTIADSFTENDDDSYDAESDTVTVTEWWFRQPEDGEQIIHYMVDDEKLSLKYKWKAGDIALCVLIDGKEVKYVPKYWNNTDCEKYPFVIYDKIPNESSIWGKSELEMIIPLIDAADRELAFAQYNSAFSSNDIIIAEENALSDDCELDNSPGAVWKLRPGMMGKIQRLGNAAYSENAQYNNCANFRNLMQETTGNFDLYQGKEPARVTTATGIALLNERSKSRQSLKKIDKAAGFKRLYELVDRTALEYYDDGRIIKIGAAGEKNFVYRFSDYSENAKNGDMVYIPVVDVKIHIGDGLSNSKAFTISAISDLIKTPINEGNYRIVKAFLELIDIPMRKEICDMLDERFTKPKAADAEAPKHRIRNEMKYGGLQ